MGYTVLAPNIIYKNNNLFKPEETDVSCQLSDICAQKPSEYMHGASIQSSFFVIEPIREKLSTLISLIDFSGWFELFFSRDGKPYCEKDYQAEFGVTCAGCGGYIIGKVLQVNSGS